MQRTKVDINFQVREFERRLPPEYEITAYRMVQECLNNIAKHSKATAAKILVASHPGKLYVRVADNGKGMTYRAADGGSSGEWTGAELSGPFSVPRRFCLVAEIPAPVFQWVAAAAEGLQYIGPAS